MKLKKLENYKNSAIALIFVDLFCLIILIILSILYYHSLHQITLIKNPDKSLLQTNQQLKILTDDFLGFFIIVSFAFWCCCLLCFFIFKKLKKLNIKNKQEQINKIYKNYFFSVILFWFVIIWPISFIFGMIASFELNQLITSCIKNATSNQNDVVDLLQK